MGKWLTCQKNATYLKFSLPQKSNVKNLMPRKQCMVGFETACDRIGGHQSCAIFLYKSGATEYASPSRR